MKRCGAIAWQNFDRVGIHKACVATIEREAAVFELTLAIAGEIGDECAFAITDGTDIDAVGNGFEAEFGGVADVKLAIGGFDERFARHAATQDAQAAEFLSAVDDGDTQTGAMRSACRCIAATAAAYDHEVEVVF